MNKAPAAAVAEATATAAGAAAAEATAAAAAVTAATAAAAAALPEQPQQPQLPGGSVPGPAYPVIIRFAKAPIAPATIVAALEGNNFPLIQTVKLRVGAPEWCRPPSPRPMATGVSAAASEREDSDKELEQADAEEEEQRPDDDAARSRVLSVRLPHDGITLLLKAFAAADAQNVESACWLLAKQGLDPQTPLVVVALITDHQVRDGGVVDVSSGIAQLTAFLVEHEDLCVVGWCLFCPRKRTANPSTADLQRTWLLQRKYRLESGFFLGLCWRGVKGKVLGGVCARVLKNEQRDLFQDRAGRIDTNFHDVAEFFDEVPITVIDEARPLLDVVHKGAWMCVASRGARSASAAPTSRPLVATACGQVGQDLLRALRDWHVEGGDAEFSLDDWLFNYIPPGGLQSTVRLHQLAKEAIRALRQEGMVEATRPKRDSPVTEWRVKLIGQ